MKTGDTVKHIPSGEKWIVGSLDRRYVYPVGSQLSGEIEQCEVLHECTESESVALMSIIARGDRAKDVNVEPCEDELAKRKILERRVSERRVAGDRRKVDA